MTKNLHWSSLLLVGATVAYLVNRGESEADPSIVIGPYGDRSKTKLSIDWTAQGNWQEWLQSEISKSDAYLMDKYGEITGDWKDPAAAPYTLDQPVGLMPPGGRVNTVDAGPNVKMEGTLNEIIEPYWQEEEINYKMVKVRAYGLLDRNVSIDALDVRNHFHKMVTAWNHGYVFKDQADLELNLFRLFAFTGYPKHWPLSKIPMLKPIEPWPLPRK